MRRPAVVLACLLAALAVAACGRSSRTSTTTGRRRAPGLGVKSSEPEATHDLGFPAFATKNTTRIGGADPIANAAGVARAVFPATTPDNRPDAVALIDARDWRAGIAGAVLASTPMRAAILLSNGPDLPPARRDALAALQPLGAKAAGGAQVVRVGDVARPPGLRTTDIAGRDPSRWRARWTPSRPRRAARAAIASSSSPPTTPPSPCRPPRGRPRPATRSSSSTATACPRRRRPRCWPTTSRASTSSGRRRRSARAS